MPDLEIDSLPVMIKINLPGVDREKPTDKGRKRSMKKSVHEVLLWLFVINLGIAFGAGIYEARIVIPGFADAPPHTWPNTGLLFWGLRHHGPSHPVDSGQHLCGIEIPGPQRKWHLAAVGILIVERLATFSYFIPTMAGLMGTTGSSQGEYCRRVVRMAAVQSRAPFAHPVRVAGRVEGPHPRKPAEGDEKFLMNASRWSCTASAQLLFLFPKPLPERSIVFPRGLSVYARLTAGRETSENGRVRHSFGQGAIHMSAPNILIVEDDREISRLIDTYLRKEGNRRTGRRTAVKPACCSPPGAIIW